MRLSRRLARLEDRQPVRAPPKSYREQLIAQIEAILKQPALPNEPELWRRLRRARSIGTPEAMAEWARWIDTQEIQK